MLTSIEKDDGETPHTHEMPKRDRTTMIVVTRGPTPNADPYQRVPNICWVRAKGKLNYSHYFHSLLTNIEMDDGGRLAA